MSLNAAVLGSTVFAVDRPLGEPVEVLAAAAAAPAEALEFAPRAVWAGLLPSLHLQPAASPVPPSYESRR